MLPWEHIGAATLEAYSLEKLGPEGQKAAEDHLLGCAACRNRLIAIEPFNAIHLTQDGPFYLRITERRDGSYWAHHWGCQMDGGDFYLDLFHARQFLLYSFLQMFPEHECGEKCAGSGSARRVGAV